MPIYEYRCQQCDHELERLQKMSEDPLRDCPACEEPALQRLVSAAGFRLKGGGWYETDFKQGDNKRNLAESTTQSAGTDGGSHNGSSKTESKKNDTAKSNGAKPASNGSGSAGTG